MSVDCIERLHTIISQPENDDLNHQLSLWNDELEVLWRREVEVPSSVQSSVMKVGLLVREVSDLLCDTFLELMCGHSLHQSLTSRANQAISAVNPSQLAMALLDSWKENKIAFLEKIEWSDLCSFVRTIKNWWRWYLQIYQPQKVSQLDGDNVGRIVDPWRSIGMLEALLLLIEAFADHSKSVPTDCPSSNGSQHVSNLFFYITYPFSVNDASLSESYHFMTSHCQLMDRFLSLLIRPDVGMPLRLSILRNVHNALVSFPKVAIEPVSNAFLSVSLTSAPDWIYPNESNNFTYSSVLPDLLLHALKFPNDSASWDYPRNSELVVETLRCCYALNATMDSRWHKIFAAILQLDVAKEQSFLDCQCAVVPMLMDAPHSFRDNLTEESILALVRILDHQATKVVLQDRCVDDRAAAALNPILAVLYKLCVDHHGTGTIRSLVFPDWQERSDRETPKNMTPTDAPEGTLRWKLIQLLTWPQGFVKRLAGELLFVLCDSQQPEFIYRVGMGNAVAFLSIKGLIQLPGSVHS